jgi:hypothetical protein
VRHVLVKFSPPVETEVGQRWSDLLIAEHLALETLSAAGISSAMSRIFRFETRTYLEVDRFDRVGLTGRVGVTSLSAIDTGFYGAPIGKISYFHRKADMKRSAADSEWA